MESMGLNNVQAVYAKTVKGELSKRRDTGEWVLDSFALNVLTYMASVAMDYGYEAEDGRAYYPNCYYKGGWYSIARNLGLLSVDKASAQVLGRDNLYRKRRNTAKSRISKAWRFLSERGLIKKVQPASMESNAGFVLTLLDDADNKLLVQEATEILGLEQPDIDEYVIGE